MAELAVEVVKDLHTFNSGQPCPVRASAWLTTYRLLESERIL